MDQFFVEMGSIYGYRWFGQFPNDAMTAVAKSGWYETLEDFNEQQIKRGLSYCRKNGNEFPPSMPQFRKMCLPSKTELGIMGVDEAYDKFIQAHRQFENGKLKQLPLFQGIRSRIDMFRFRQMSAKESKALFKTVYNECVEEIVCENKNILKLEHDNARQ